MAELGGTDEVLHVCIEEDVSDEIVLLSQVLISAFIKGQRILLKHFPLGNVLVMF